MSAPFQPVCTDRVAADMVISMKKRLLSLILAVALLAGVLTVPANAADSTGVYRDIAWNYSSSGKVLTLSGTGRIPSSFGSSGALGKALGGEKSQVKKIVIGDGITAVGSDAFYSYSSLEELIIPKTMTDMDESCLSNSYSLKSVRFLGDLPSGDLCGEFFIFGDATVYCPKEYFEHYKYLMTYVSNEAHTASSHMRPVKICTSQTDVTIEMNKERVILSALEPACQLSVYVNGTAVTSGIRWSSLDPGRAAVDSNGRVTLGKDHGSTLICAEFPIGNDTALVTCQVYATRNSALVSCLPTSGVQADFPVTCNTSIHSKEGILDGYNPAKFVESDTGNPYYQEILQLTNSLTRNCSTDTEKARAIHKWVSENIDYGGMLAIGDHADQIYAVYVARSSHCQGYSYLTGFMLYLAGIPNATVISIDHMWNIALLDGKWVMIDSTWGEFGFDYDDADHGYATCIAFGQGDCCLIINDSTGVKLAGVGPHELERAGLTTITVPDYVTALYGYCFAYCEDLKRVYLPNGISYIGGNLFHKDEKLTDIFYDGTLEEWDAIDNSASLAGQTGAGVTFHAMRSSAASEPPASTSSVAYAIPQIVQVDGRPVTFQTYALRDATGNYTNYTKLRDLAVILSGTKAQFSVDWRAGQGIFLTKGALYLPNGSELYTPFSGNRAYKNGTGKTRIDSVSCDIPSIVLTDDNGGEYTYFKLRDMGRYLGFNVSYINKQVVVNTNEPYSDDQ